MARVSSWAALPFALAMAIPLVVGGCGDSTSPLDTAADDGGTFSPDGNAGGIDAAGPPVPRDAGDAATPGKDASSPDLAPVPKLLALAPTQAIVGAVGPTLVATGSDFVKRSVLQVNGAPLPTSFVSAGELRATLPPSFLAFAQLLHVTVGTAPPGGGASAELPFSVVNPLPSIVSLQPTNAPLGSPDVPLTVHGALFVTGASIDFDGTALTTTRVNDTTLTAVIPKAKLATSGSFLVRAVNPAPGGGPSSPIAFIVTNPTVSVTSVTPDSAVVGSGATKVSLTGAGFVAASAVSFNGTAVASTTADAQHITATIPAALLGNVGDLPIVVTNPAPGGGVSAPVTFHVVYPAPTASSLSPASMVVGDAPPTVTITGAGFFAGRTQVQFDGAAVPTSVVDATHVQATPPAAQTTIAKTLAVTVSNPAPGGGTSAPALSFRVENPGPTLTSVAPSTIVVGAGDTTVTLSGTGFVDASVVKSNGTVLTSTLQSATSITAVVPASQLASAGTLSLTVSNPAPGGGTSNAQAITVGCNTTGVNYVLTSANQTTTIPLDFSTAPLASRITTSVQFGAAQTCPRTPDSSVSSPFRAYVVQNGTGASLTLSAWAVCSGNSSHMDDAFLAFYNRSTPPATQSDLEQCTGVVAEGDAGAGGFSSPDSNGSSYCPGLTKSNGQGYTLAACAKALVVIQPWTGTSSVYTMPSALRVKVE